MKTKKTVITVLAVTLLISAALVVGCMNQLDELTDRDMEDIPVGKGVVRFRISDSNARTVLPTAPVSMVYDIKFEADGNSANDKNLTKVDLTTAETAVSLSPDTYTVTITAFDSATESIPIAGWDNTLNTTHALGVVVGAGDAISITANLLGFVNGDDEGTFECNINIPTGVTYVSTLDIKGYSNTTVKSLVLATGVNAISETLDSGYYTVTFKFVEAHCQTIEYKHALHIYPTLTSTLTAVPTPPVSLDENEFEVDFDLNSEPVSNASGTFNSKYIGYAQLVSIANPVPSTSGRTFAGWYSNVGLTVPWTIASDRITSSGVTLYAKFNSVSPGNITFTITFSFADEASGVTPTATTIQRGTTFDEGYSITLVLDAPVSDSWASVEWSIGDISSAIISTHMNGNDLEITNTTDFGPILAGDSFVVSVIGTKTGGGIYSPPPVTITVTP